MRIVLLLVIIGNNQYKFRFLNNSGNIISESESYNIKIDNNSPSFDYSLRVADDNEITDVTILINDMYDNESGIAQDKPISIYMQEVTEEEAEHAYDEQTNVSDYIIEENLIYQGNETEYTINDININNNYFIIVTVRDEIGNIHYALKALRPPGSR